MNAGHASEHADAIAPHCAKHAAVKRGANPEHRVVHAPPAAQQPARQKLPPTVINYPAASRRGIKWNLENFAEGLFALILIFSRQSLGEFDPERLKEVR